MAEILCGFQLVSLKITGIFSLPPLLFQILAKTRDMRTLLLIFIFFFSFSLEASADYFKWEILFAAKGFGTESNMCKVVLFYFISSIRNFRGY